MRIKLDENLGQQVLNLFRAAGHDTSTVPGQSLCGAADRDLIEVCKLEERALVTLDLDFANPLRFRPSEYSGIAVLRPSAALSPKHLGELCQTLLEALSRESLHHRLWIVERARIRIYEQPEE